MSNATAALCCMAIILAFALAGTIDLESEIKSHNLYCEMTALYTESNGQHGWPAYKEGVQCP